MPTFNVTKTDLNRAITALADLADASRDDQTAAIDAAIKPAKTAPRAAYLSDVLAHDAIAPLLAAPAYPELRATDDDGNDDDDRTPRLTRLAAALSDDSAVRTAFNAAITARTGKYPREKTTARDAAYFALILLAASIDDSAIIDDDGNATVTPDAIVRTHAAFGDAPTAFHNGTVPRNPLTVSHSAKTGKRVSAPLLNRGIFDIGCRFDRSGDIDIAPTGYTVSIERLAAAVDQHFGINTAERIASVERSDVPTLAGTLSV